jgi:SPRY domain
MTLYLRIGFHMQEPMLFKKKKSGTSTTTFAPTFKDTSVTLLNSNLRANCSNAGGGAYLTTQYSSGKWYAEFTMIQFEGPNLYSAMIGLASNTTPYKNAWNADTNELFWYNGGGSSQFIYRANQRFNYGTVPVVGDVIGIALDMDAKTIYFVRNGTAFSTVTWGASNYSSSTVFRAGVSSPNGQAGATICDFNQTPLYLPSGYNVW